MKTFKEFADLLTEAYLDSYGGKKLISTIHYGERADERKADLPVIKHLFRKATDHLNTHDYGDHREFLFYSKKHNRAVVFDHRRDSYNKKDPSKHLVAVTILPKGRKDANPGTKPIMVEGYSQQFLDYIDEFIPLEERSTSPLTNMLYEGIDFYFYDGQLQNIPFTEFFEVD